MPRVSRPRGTRPSAAAAIALVTCLALFSPGCGSGERCMSGTPDAEDDPSEEPAGCGECDDGDPCTTDSCDEETYSCTHALLDADGDGHIAERAPDGTLCGGDDCDDARADIHPGATDTCDDGVDADCDGFAGGLSTIGPEVRLSIDDSRDSTGPALAWSGNILGVAWTDTRDGNEEVYFTRVDSSGAEIGEETRITDSWGTSGVASVAWTGSEFGIAWADRRTGSTLVTGLRKVGEDGIMIGEEVLVPAAAWGSLAWTGRGWGAAALALDETDYLRKVYLSVLGEDCGVEAVTVLASVAYSGEWLSFSTPSMVWTGSELGVLWGEDRDAPHAYYDDRLMFDTVAEDGGVTGDAVQLLWDTSGTMDAGTIGLAWTGSEYGMVWGGTHLSFARVSASGEMGVTTAIAGGDDQTNRYTEIRWTGSEFGILWNSVQWLPPPGGSVNRLLLARLEPDGGLLEPPILVNDPSFGYWGHAVAWMGNAYGIAWTDLRSEPAKEIYLRLVIPCP